MNKIDKEFILSDKNSTEHRIKYEDCISWFFEYIFKSEFDFTNLIYDNRYYDLRDYNYSLDFDDNSLFFGIQ